MIVDASVAIKWFVTDDRLHAAAVAIAVERRLIAPTLLLAEVANGLWKYARTGRLSPDDVIEATGLLQSECRLVSDGDLIAPAQRLSLEHDHPVYDCMYASLAIRESAPLLTADERLVRKLRGAPGLRLMPLSEIAT